MKNIILILFISSLLLHKTFTAQNLIINHYTNIINEHSVAFDSGFHFTIKPFTPKDFSKFNYKDSVSIKNKHLNSLFNKNLLSLKTKKASVHINPIIQSQVFIENGNHSLISDNRLGISLNLSLNKKWFFTSNFFYSSIDMGGLQKNLVDSFSIIPHFGKYTSKKNNNYSFLSFAGELTYQATDNISFHIGNGKHFLGNGYRSLFLSDNSNSYPYIKTTVDIWRIKYFWMIAKLYDFELYYTSQDFSLYKKALFTHYFSLNITNRINFNFFETIISNPYDHNGNKIGYEYAYFNPVIFYRPVEFYSGTSDNSLIGIGANLRLFKGLHLYSQFILDDLIISTLKDGSGWWGNKFGVQAGMKAFNLLNIEGLFLRGEINIIRPYTYSHGITFSENAINNLNYGNYHQNLAHPSGANFAEAISVIRYIKNRVSVSAKIILSKKGVDNDSASFGNDIYKAYNLRPGDYGIKFLQGTITDFSFIDLNVSYLINPNYNLRFKLGVYNRKENNNFSSNIQTLFYFGFSSNLYNELSDY